LKQCIVTNSGIEMGRWQSHLLAALEERPLTILVLATLWLALEFVALGPYSYVNAYDIAHYASTAMGLRDAPGLWYPDGVAGLDLAATQHVIPMDFFLYRVLPGFVAYQIYVLIGLGGAAYFTYLLLRRQVGLRADAAVMGGMIYAALMATNYSSYMFNYALIPAVVWMQDAVWRRRLLLALPGVVFLALFYASFSRVVFAVPFIPLAGLLWYSLVQPRKAPRFWLFMTLFWFVYAITKLPEIWSLLLHLPLSHRPFNPTKSHGADLVFTDTFELFSGLFYWKNGFGLPLLFPIVTAVVAPKVGRTYIRVLIALISLPVIVIFAMVMLRTLPVFTESGLSSFSLPRFRFVAVFLIAVACGLALHHWTMARRAGGAGGIALVMLAGLFCLSLAGKAATLSQWSYTGGFAALYDNREIHRLAEKLEGDGGGYRIGVYNIFNGYFHGYGIETLGGWYSILPLRYGRFLDRLNGRNEDQWLKDGVGVWNRDFNLDLAALANMKYFASFLPFENSRLRLLAGPDRPSSKLSMREKALFAASFNFGLADKYYIYENAQALPRFFLTNQVRSFSDKDELLAALSSASLAELRNTAYLEGPAPTPSPNFASGSVRVLTYGADHIALRVAADGPAFLVAVNSYSPYWKARVDGREVPMRPAYHAFWGLEVPAGQHRIEWTYEPPYKKISFLDLRWFWSFRWP
jgi:hypothetical protein